MSVTSLFRLSIQVRHASRGALKNEKVMRNRGASVGIVSGGWFDSFAVVEWCSGVRRFAGFFFLRRSGNLPGASASFAVEWFYRIGSGEDTRRASVERFS